MILAVDLAFISLCVRFWKDVCEAFDGFTLCSSSTCGAFLRLDDGGKDKKSGKVDSW